MGIIFLQICKFDFPNGKSTGSFVSKGKIKINTQ